MGKFFEHVKDKLKRDYTLIIDRSKSMKFVLDDDIYHNGKKWVYPYADDKKDSRWYHAEKAVKLLAPAICACDPDGVTIHLFSDEGTDSFKMYEHIKHPDEVHKIFDSVEPNGGTDLHGILKKVVKQHWEQWKKHKKPETVLIITDGQPDSEEKVWELLLETANSLDDGHQLSFTFIQIGSSETAHWFLKKLDNRLKKTGGAKHDIVDTQSYGGESEDHIMDFEKLIHESLEG